MIRSRSVSVTRSLAPAALVALLCGLAPARAAAHELVDEGRRLYEEAEFVAALDVLGRAVAGSDLDLDDVVSVFETRALVHLAMGQPDAMREDLRRLAAIRPDHALPSVAPPDMVSAFAEIRAASSGAPRLAASTEAAALGVTITARVENDAVSLVREVRVSGRAVGSAAWERATGAPLFVPTPDGEVVEYFAEAIGPGGAVIARTGDEHAPLRAAPAAVAAAPSGGMEAWPWIVGGVGVAVVAAVVVTVVVLTTGGGQSGTDVAPFTVRF